ncbi:MAG: type II toxin-antitoxin system HicB family antitoxin [Solirubrobacteraceae bacterium]
MELTVVVHQERGSYWSEIPELPGCFASGRTVDELGDALAEAVGMYLWDLPGELQRPPTGLGESTVVVTPAVAGTQD